MPMLSEQTTKIIQIKLRFMPNSFEYSLRSRGVGIFNVICRSDHFDGRSQLRVGQSCGRPGICQRGAMKAAEQRAIVLSNTLKPDGPSCASLHPSHGQAGSCEVQPWQEI
jgi:hypothetical protein